MKRVCVSFSIATTVNGPAFSCEPLPACVLHWSGNSPLQFVAASERHQGLGQWLAASRSAQRAVQSCPERVGHRPLLPTWLPAPFLLRTRHWPRSRHVHAPGRPNTYFADTRGKIAIL